MPERVAVVVGAASGIGRATADLLADSFTLVEVDRVEGGVVADVTDPGSLTDCAAHVTRTHGRLDALVVTAGVVATAAVDAVTDEEARRTFDVNVLGALSVVKAHLVLLRATPGDRSVTLLSSVAASLGGGLLGGSVYAASKAAVEGLTRGLARELAADGIRVNALAPGPVDTPLLTGHLDDVHVLDDATLLGRIGRPAEIAQAVGYLVSAEFVTGQVLHVDGGASFG